MIRHKLNGPGYHVNDKRLYESHLTLGGGVMFPTSL